MNYTIRELREKMKPGETLVLKKEENCKSLIKYPQAGPKASIKGMRKLYWGKYSKIVKKSDYIYLIDF